MDKSELISAYRLISELFLHPEDRDGGLINAEITELGAAPAELRALLQAFLADPVAANAGEYVATLELAPPVPLYFGSYLYDEPKSCQGAGMSGRNGYMLELANIYRHFGIESTGRELADFVPVVIEFLGISLERSDEDQIGLRRYLVETLLINAVESLWSALRKHESPYARLIEALRVALTEDIARMAGDIKWMPPKDGDQPQVSAAVSDSMAIGQAAFENEAKL